MLQNLQACAEYSMMKFNRHQCKLKNKTNGIAHMNKWGKFISNTCENTEVLTDLNLHINQLCSLGLKIFMSAQAIEKKWNELSRKKAIFPVHSEPRYWVELQAGTRLQQEAWAIM